MKTLTLLFVLGTVSAVFGSQETSKTTRSSIDKNTFAEECLARHNHYRALHGVPDLTLDPELSAFAQEWADKLSINEKAAYRKDNKYGENIWSVKSNKLYLVVNGSQPIDSWYTKEFSKYVWNDQEPTKQMALDAGHLTQVLWASSKKLGVGVAQSGYRTYVVCNYDPEGNYLGDFLENVPAPLGSTVWSPLSNDKDSSEESSEEENSSSSTDPVAINNPVPTRTLSDFDEGILKCHNDYRDLHGVPHLTYNLTIAAFAQEWADYLASNSLFEHRTKNNPYGENLYWSSKNTTLPIKACAAWYKEIKYYPDFSVDPTENNPFSSFMAGHFTQMLWKSAKQVGCAKGVNSLTRAMIIACNYTPPGNHIGKFVENVLKPVAA